MSRPLLAYDGSPKAKEALYVATYLSGSWSIPLLVVSVAGDDINEETLDDARAYLERHQIEADYVFTDGPVAEILMAIAQDQAIDLFILGGYGGIPVVEVVLGNVVDTFLGSSEIPMLIGR
jgi:nucleotide-binding universal stress UspA family protein